MSWMSELSAEVEQKYFDEKFLEEQKEIKEETDAICLAAVFVLLGIMLMCGLCIIT